MQRTLRLFPNSTIIEHIDIVSITINMQMLPMTTNQMHSRINTPHGLTIHRFVAGFFSNAIEWTYWTFSTHRSFRTSAAEKWSDEKERNFYCSYVIRMVKHMVNLMSCLLNCESINFVPKRICWHPIFNAMAFAFEIHTFTANRANAQKKTSKMRSLVVRQMENI